MTNENFARLLDGLTIAVGNRKNRILFYQFLAAEIRALHCSYGVGDSESYSARFQRVARFNERRFEGEGTAHPAAPPGGGPSNPWCGRAAEPRAPTSLRRFCRAHGDCSRAINVRLIALPPLFFLCYSRSVCSLWRGKRHHTVSLSIV